MTTTSLHSLYNVITTLLGSEGCPWDKEQTPLSLCEYILEESYELVAAIRENTAADVCEELGDVFFLLVFIAILYEKQSAFTLHDVLEQSAAKMIRRHPHIFGEAVFADRTEQMQAWEAIKRSEKTTEDGKPADVFATLPEILPSLLKAYRIHSKAARAGFTWESDSDVEQQVEAEWLELLDAMHNSDSDAQAHELGDLMFTLVELGRRKGIKANAALEQTNLRFLKRFSHMEQQAQQEGKEFASLSMEEKNMLWDNAKQVEA